MTLLQASNGDIWVGGFSGLGLLHEGHWVENPLTQRLRGRIVWALHQDGDGAIWAGTDRGLFRSDGANITQITQRDGLPDEFVYAIVESADKSLWVNGPHNVARISRSDLDALRTGSRTQLSPQTFAVSRELDSAELYTGIQPAGLLTTTGDLIYPSNKGLIQIRERKEPAIPDFPLVVNQVSVDGRELADSATVRLGPYSSRLVLGFSAVLLGPQDRIHLKYRLNNFDRDWQDAGELHAATYTNLPPGKYVFRVVAVTAGNVQVAETQISIQKASPFYRNPWFMLGCVVLAIALAWLAHWQRLRRERQQFSVVLEERGRVAREMHDTVIQGCSTISALLEASASLVDTDQEGAAELNGLARQSIQTTILEARQAIWGLRHASDQDPTLGDGLQRMATAASRDFGIPVTFERSGQPFDLPSSATYQLLMATREALHNAFLHAKPTKVDLALTSDSKFIVVSISDDGSGMPGPLSTTDGDHYGIRGIRERMDEIGGTFHIQTAPRRGTQITLRLAIRAAA